MRRLLIFVASVASVIFVGVSFWSICAYAVDRYGVLQTISDDDIKMVDFVIVPGCWTYRDGSLSWAFKYRIQTSVDFYLTQRDHLPSNFKVVYTGGKNESIQAADFAIKLGLPADVVLTENWSTTTEQNAIFAANVTAHFAPIRKIIIISDTYHLFRCKILFLKYFENVHSLPSYSGFFERIYGSIREVPAICKNIYNGNIDWKSGELVKLALEFKDVLIKS